MKAITLWQPWATWVVLGMKTIETRPHPKLSSLAGKRIAIHAGLKWDDDAFDLARPFLSAENEYYTASMVHSRGKIIGAVDVVGFRKMLVPEDSQRALIECVNIPFSRYGLILENPTVFDEPVPMKGSQGIWNWPTEMSEQEELEL